MRQLLCLLLFCVTVMAIHAQTVTERGAEAYNLQDYQTAITLYEEAISSGQHSGATFYNLGNAYYEAGILGQAMLNYRRAAVYLPRDSDLSINLARVRAQRTTITTGETDWLNQLATLTNDSLTLFELSILVFAAWILFFLMLAIGVVRGGQDGNYRLLVAIVGVILLGGLILMGSRVYVETQRPTAVVMADSAVVMSGPGLDYLSIYTIQAAAEVRIIESSGDWVRFTLPDGRGGWVSRSHLMLVNEGLG
jgi:hypothetical protein